MCVCVCVCVCVWCRGVGVYHMTTTGQCDWLLTNKLVSVKEKTPLMSSLLRMATRTEEGSPIVAPPTPLSNVTSNVYKYRMYG